MFTIQISKIQKDVLVKLLANAYLEMHRLKNIMKTNGAITELTSNAIATDLNVMNDLQAHIEKTTENDFIAITKKKFQGHLEAMFTERGESVKKSYHYSAACCLQNLLLEFGVTEAETNAITQSAREKSKTPPSV